MNAIIPLALDTLSSAALIFFAAVGLTLVFNVLRVLNVAHGSFYSIGGYLAASLCLFVLSRQLNPYLSFVALLFSAVLVAVIFGPLVESTLIRWTRGKSEAVQILITFGLFLILEDLQRMVFGVQSFYEDTPMRLMGSTSIGGIVYLNYQIALIAMAVLVVIGLRLIIKHTRYGRLITAVVFDREMAQSIGINTNMIFIFAFSLGVFLAALIVGLARVLAIYFAPSMDAVAPYAAMLIVLLVRPYGLFGAVTARRI